MADNSVETPSEILSRLSQALIQISRGDPIVSLRQELSQQFTSIDTRFKGIDRATELQHEDLVRVPTEVDRAIGGLRDLLKADIGTAVATIKGELSTHIAETKEKFSSVNSTFAQGDKALTAALQAQEKQAIATNDSNKAASDKMETGFTEALKQGREFLEEVRKSNEIQFNAINSRLDKNEGRTNVSDPVLTETLRSLAAAVATLRDSSHTGDGASKQTGVMIGYAFGFIGMLIGIAGLALAISHGVR